MSFKIKFHFFASHNLWLAFVVFLGLICNMNCRFIELRLYPPLPNRTLGIDNNLTKLIWIDDTQLGENLGYHKPYIFPSRPLPNRYGSLVSILQREINTNPSLYPLVHSGSIAEVRIREFKLESHDGCWKNRVFIDMKLDIIGSVGKRNLEYKDEIISHVTDCFLIGSSITIVPLLWYIPYMGFRGNREDQLNQLGRNAIYVILESLEGND